MLKKWNKTIILLMSLSPNILGNLFVTRPAAAAQWGQVENPGEALKWYKQFWSLSTSLYRQSNLAAASLPWEVWQRALAGYLNGFNKDQYDSPILAIIDFSLPSDKKRLWMVNLAEKKLLLHTLVAHGKGSGDRFAVRFSNSENSLMSSVGFYRTDGEYSGKHGRSLRLEGLEPGVNDNAKRRAIVLHGADYVNPGYISEHGRLGRSWGCPAVDREEVDGIIDILNQGRSALYIDFPDLTYWSVSPYLSLLKAGEAIANWGKELGQGRFRFPSYSRDEPLL